MKTLSFVKQAMAVALLISAVNASAMQYIKAFGAKAVALAEQPARLTGKVFGYIPVGRGKPAVQVKNGDKFVGKDGQEYDTIEGMTLKNTEPRMTVAKPAPTVASEVYKKFEAYGMGKYLLKPENAGKKSALLVTTSAVIVAGVSYGIYKAYKALTGKAVVAEQDQAQEEAQPEVEATVVEETTQEVAQPIVRKQRVA